VSKIGALHNLPFDLLQEHACDGTIPTNARFLFYQLVQHGHLSKERKGARRTGSLRRELPLLATHHSERANRVRFAVFESIIPTWRYPSD
jgi:hypothetical protein